MGLRLALHPEPHQNRDEDPDYGDLTLSRLILTPIRRRAELPAAEGPKTIVVSGRATLPPYCRSGAGFQLRQILAHRNRVDRAVGRAAFRERTADASSSNWKCQVSGRGAGTRRFAFRYSETPLVADELSLLRVSPGLEN